MLQSEWGGTVVLDLFLSGFGGCLFAASALLVLVAGDKHQQSARIASWVSFASVLAGVLCLLADVGQPLRAMVMPLSFSNFGSWMPRGAWSLAIALIVFLLFALSFESKVTNHIGTDAAKRARMLRSARIGLGVVGIIAGLFVTLYTGFLLKDSVNIPFWDTLFLPATFVCSSLAAGCGTLLLIVALMKEGEKNVVRVLAGASIVLPLVCGGLIAAYLSSMSTGSGAESAAWVMESPAFIVGAIGAAALLAGGVIALVFSERSRSIVAPAAVACIAVIALGLAIRFCAVGAGSHEALMSIDAFQAVDGITYLFR